MGNSASAIDDATAPMTSESAGLYGAIMASRMATVTCPKSSCSSRLDPNREIVSSAAATTASVTTTNAACGPNGDDVGWAATRKTAQATTSTTTAAMPTAGCCTASHWRAVWKPA